MPNHLQPQNPTVLYERDPHSNNRTALLVRQDDPNYDNITFPAYGDHISKGGEAGIAVGVFVFLVIVGVLGWFLWSRMRARKLGGGSASMNPFSDSNRVGGSRSGGAFGWIKDKIGSAQRRRTAGGAYESNTGQTGAVGLGGPSGGRGGRSQRAFGGLDPDEAWDSRVGTEANGYGYEEQELSLRGAPPAHLDDDTGYGGPRYGRTPAHGNSESGKTELDQRYEQEMHRHGVGHNPFEDAEPSNMSLRELSPRHSLDSNGTVERKSAFREAI